MNIEELMKEKNIKNSYQLALKAEVAPSLIHNLIRGKDIRLSTANKIAKALDVKIEDLIQE